MPRTVAPVQPYMADNSAIIKAMQSGWEMGNKAPTIVGSISTGISEGMDMAKQYMEMQDKYGADAQAAKERKAQMEELQIQSAQQQLTRGDLMTQQLQAEQPYFGQKAANEAKTSDINLEMARLNQTRMEATTANLPTEINNKNTETQLGITTKALSLSEQQRAMGNELQKETDRLALSNQFSAAQTPDDFVAARKSLNEYWGKNGMGDYDKLSAQFALEAKRAGVTNDPKVSGYINSGTPFTIAGVEKSVQTYQQLADKSAKSLNDWASTFHQGGKFQLDANGEPLREQIPDPSNPSKMISGPKIGEDWSKVKQVVTEHFQTPKTDAAGHPAYGNDGLPVMEAPKVADVMANLNFVGSNDKGQLIFRNSAKSTNNTFSVDPAEGNRLLDLIHSRDNFKNAGDGVTTGIQTLRYMTDQGKTVISPDELKQFKQQIAKPAVVTESAGAVNAANSGNSGVLPDVKTPQQELALYAQQWRSIYGKGGTGESKANNVTLQSLKLLKEQDPGFYSEVVRIGSDTRVPLSVAPSQATTPGIKTGASYYQPLP